MQDKFNTTLSEENEQRFQNWLKLEAERRGRDLSKDLENYDLRGYWYHGGYQDKTGKGHMPDTYKKPNHPTFSDESMYHGADLGNNEIAIGGKWGEGIFMPGNTNIKFHGVDNLSRYFKQFEPDTRLIF